MLFSSATFLFAFLPVVAFTLLSDSKTLHGGQKPLSDRGQSAVLCVG